MFNKVIKYHVASANNENGKFCHVILTEPDNPKTFASAILLSDFYRGLEVDYYSKKYNIDIFKPEFKNLSNFNLLKIIRQAAQRKFLQKSNLICEYCKTPVKLSDGKNRNRFTATVDHFIPQKQGYDPFDEGNFRVCCNKCNTEKGELSYTEWKNKNFK